MALRLVCAREAEIELRVRTLRGFEPEEYWTVDADMADERPGRAALDSALPGRRSGALRRELGSARGGESRPGRGGLLPRF